jgi:hypothetical protein
MANLKKIVFDFAAPVFHKGEKINPYYGVYLKKDLYHLVHLKSHGEVVTHRSREPLLELASRLENETREVEGSLSHPSEAPEAIWEAIADKVREFDFESFCEESEEPLEAMWIDTAAPFYGDAYLLNPHFVASKTRGGWQLSHYRSKGAVTRAKTRKAVIDLVSRLEPIAATVREEACEQGWNPVDEGFNFFNRASEILKDFPGKI